MKRDYDEDVDPIYENPITDLWRFRNLLEDGGLEVRIDEHYKPLDREMETTYLSMVITGFPEQDGFSIFREIRFNPDGSFKKII